MLNLIEFTQDFRSTNGLLEHLLPAGSNLAVLFVIKQWRSAQIFTRVCGGDHLVVQVLDYVRLIYEELLAQAEDADVRGSSDSEQERRIEHDRVLPNHVALLEDVE